jgi:hypothetical protein
MGTLLIALMGNNPTYNVRIKVCLFVCLIVFNATFNNISVISYYWWRKPENPEKTTDLSQVTDKLYHIMLYTEVLRKVKHFLLHKLHPSCYFCYKPGGKDRTTNGTYP